MQLTCVSADIGLEGATLIAGVMQSLEPLPGSEEAVAAIDRSIIESAGFAGKSGETIALPHEHAQVLLLVGVGEEASFDSIRSASGNAIRKVKTERAVSLLARAGVDESTRAVVEGSMLGGYQFRQYKTDDESALEVETVELVDGDPDEVDDAVLASESTILARNWVNTPAKDLSPELLAESIAAATDGTPIAVEIWDKSKIEEEKLGALLGVAAGSDRDPRVVILQYRPDEAVSHVALVGKGITFDSGGLSLKTAQFMEEMKDDMSGAAVIAAATIGIAKLGLPIDVTAIAPLTDNAVGGDATRPGDVLRPVEGPTIEVLNTDAEGRLILADGLGIAKRFEPDLTIDVATLTGAAVVALGKQVAAVFGSDSEVSGKVLDAAGRAGEQFWELPLFKGYRKSIDSDVADIKNISGSRYGGAIVAAVFLSEYAGDGPWAHLDIAGPARSAETSGENVKGASGVGVRTLIELAKTMSGTA